MQEDQSLQVSFGLNEPTHTDIKDRMVNEFNLNSLVSTPIPKKKNTVLFIFYLVTVGMGKTIHLSDSQLNSSAYQQNNNN